MDQDSTTRPFDALALTHTLGLAREPVMVTLPLSATAFRSPRAPDPIPILMVPFDALTLALWPSYRPILTLPLQP